MKKSLIILTMVALIQPFMYAQTWSSATLTEARADCAVGVIDKKLIVAGGGTNYISLTLGKSSRIDIYDDSLGVWKTANMSTQRFNPYSAIIGKKMYILGGLEGGNNVPSNRYDVFDAVTNTVSNDTLPFKPFNTCVGYANNQIVFAGGDLDNNYTFTNKVKIWNVATNTWSSDTLSAVRGNITSVTLGTKIYFFGGLVSSGTTTPSSLLSNAVDIYDTVTRTWTRTKLSKARMYPMVTIVGKKIICLGGFERFGYVNGYISAFASKVVDVYDTETNTWTASEIAEPRAGAGAVTWEDKAYFIWGVSATATTTFDYTKINVFDPATNVWSNLTVPTTTSPRAAQTAVIGNKVFIIGGKPNLIPSNKVDILSLPRTSIFDNNLAQITLTTFPNPIKDNVQLKFRSDTQNESQVSISDVNGRIVKSKKNLVLVGENLIDFQCQDLPNGIYWVNIKSDKSTGTSLFIKQ